MGGYGGMTMNGPLNPMRMLQSMPDPDEELKRRLLDEMLGSGNGNGGGANQPQPQPAQTQPQPLLPEPPQTMTAGKGDTVNHDQGEILPPTPNTGSSSGSGIGQQPQAQTLDDLLAHPQMVHPPDVNTLPATGRLTDLQTQLDTSRSARPGILSKILHMVVPGLGIALGAKFGGVGGAGGAASGAADFEREQYGRKQHEQEDLMRQVQEQQQAQSTQYSGGLHAQQINAQNLGTAAYHRAAIASADDRNRRTVQGANDRAAGANETRLGIAGQRDTTTRLLHGIDEQGNPVPIDQLPPELQSRIGHQRAQVELMSAQQELAKARTAGIPAQIQLAQGRLQAAQQNADTFSSRLESELFGTYHGQPIPGMPTQTDDQGQTQVIGPKPYASTGPTSTTKTKIQQVNAIQAVGRELLSTIDANKDQLGPFTGRATNLEELWGNLPPAAAKIAGFQGSFAALMPGVHQMRSQKAMQDFEKRLQLGSFKTNAEAMKAGVQAAMDSTATMGKAWQEGGVGGYKGPKPTTGVRGPAQDTVQPNTQPAPGQNIINLRRNKSGGLEAY